MTIHVTLKNKIGLFKKNQRENRAGKARQLDDEEHLNLHQQTSSKTRNIC